MLTFVNTHAMRPNISSAAVGAIVREARMAAGLSQTDLGQRIGASRFWVAQFEKGKPSAELGLALKAMHALGLTVRIEPKNGSQPRGPSHTDRRSGQTDLAKIIAHATLTDSAPSSVIGWPTANAPAKRSRKS